MANRKKSPNGYLKMSVYVPDFTGWVKEGKKHQKMSVFSHCNLNKQRICLRSPLNSTWTFLKIFQAMPALYP